MSDFSRKFILTWNLANTKVFLRVEGTLVPPIYIHQTRFRGLSFLQQIQQKNIQTSSIEPWPWTRRMRSGVTDFYSTAHREVSKMASSGANYIESLIAKLSPESDSRTKKALALLAKLTKVKENVHWFCLQGGLARLLALIQRGPNTTIADMALSTLANCAREEESRREVSVCRITKCTLLVIFLIKYNVFISFSR